MWLVVDEDVFGYGEVGKEGGFLVDDGDFGCFGFGGGLEVDGVVV